MVRWIRKSTAGLKLLAKCATFALVRSTASVYCVKSFVPMLKKSMLRANRSESIAAEGTSTIMPNCTFSATGFWSPCRFSFSRSSNAFISSISSCSAIIGTIMRKSTPTPACSKARTCVRIRSSRPCSIRTPRHPKKGLSSFGKSRYGISLSPPISSVRTTIGCPSKWAKILR